MNKPFYVIVCVLSVWIQTVCAAQKQSFIDSIQWFLPEDFGNTRAMWSVEPFVDTKDFELLMTSYQNGNFSKALELLEKQTQLYLPDGRFDLQLFLYAECLRYYEHYGIADSIYNSIVNQFPRSDKVPFALFRMIEQACRSNDSTRCIQLFTYFKKNMSSHDLYSAVLDVVGRCYFFLGNFQKAYTFFRSIPSTSNLYNRALYASAVSCLGLESYRDSAITLLSTILSDRTDTLVTKHARILLAEIYFRKENYSRACEYFQSSALSSHDRLYDQLVLKACRGYLHLSHFDKAYACAKTYCGGSIILRNDEALLSLLESGAKNKKQTIAVTRLREAVNRKKIQENIVFETIAEGLRISELVRSWNKFEQKALLVQDTLLAQQARTYATRCQELYRHSLHMLYGYGAISKSEYHNDCPSLSLFRLHTIYSNNTDNDLSTVMAQQRKILQRTLSQSIAEKANNELFFDQYLCMRYIDWSFLQYLRSKNGMKSTEIDTSVTTSGYSEEYQRNACISLCSFFMDIYQNAFFTSHVRMRLAELYYDRAIEKFTKELEHYEHKMTAAPDTHTLKFPEYDMSAAIETYKKIYTHSPKDPLADDALFFMALSYIKQSNDSIAVSLLEQLVQEFPRSNYYVEAQINIGKYYFEHPWVKSNTGYACATKAYLTILRFKQHPQYVQALYQLGWSYFMQDRFQDALSVFIRLIQEKRLNFQKDSVNQNLIANPLLRDEAIDCMALCLEDKKNIDSVSNLLMSIQQPEYAALLLRRLGELKEDELDFSMAASIYKKMIELFPLSHGISQTVQKLIKIIETTGSIDAALRIRQDLFDKFRKNSVFYTNHRISAGNNAFSFDSLAIVLGRSIAEQFFLQGQETKKQELYEKAAMMYQQLLDIYQDSPLLWDVWWNLSILYNSHLRKPMSAYSASLSYSLIRGADSVKREQAAVNAVAIAQSLLTNETVQKIKLADTAFGLLNTAVDNYITLFPKGKSFKHVVMSKGSVLFNRKLYNEAIETYSLLCQQDTFLTDCDEAALMIGKCYFSQDMWEKAIAIFQRLYTPKHQTNVSSAAYTFLVQSHLLLAKQLCDTKQFKAGAEAYSATEKQFPGNTFGPLALFNAAEAYESDSSFDMACALYFAIYTRYPQSELASEALFNAALNYEKMKRLSDVANSYSLLLASYPTSQRAKEALYNSSFIYEQLGDLEKMNHAQEQYAIVYPHEKDVSAMMLRSVHFYFDKGNYRKAIELCNTFFLRFPRDAQCVQAYYLKGESLIRSGDTLSGLTQFDQAEISYTSLGRRGVTVDPYYVAEALFSKGMIQALRCKMISIDGTIGEVKKTFQAKTNCVTSTSQLFQKVMNIRSAKFFEAFIQLALLYQDFAETYSKQPVFDSDAIKLAVARKEILYTSAELMQKALTPLQKVVEISLNLDSLSAKQNMLLDTAAQTMVSTLVRCARFRMNSTEALMSAPIPEKIKNQPLYLFQYKKRMLETIEPIVVQTRDFLLMHHTNLCTTRVFIPYCPQLAHEALDYAITIAREYETLSEEIRSEKSTNSAQQSSDDLVFQLEDMIYEVQDKALALYEDALTLAKQQKNQSKVVYITQICARLNPEKYGKQMYSTVSIVTDSTWSCAADSIPNWMRINQEKLGWQRGGVNSFMKPVSVSSAGSAFILGTTNNSRRVYVRKDVFVSGISKAAKAYIRSQGAYRIFVNSTLLLKGSNNEQSVEQVDSTSEILSVLKQGVNTIGIEVTQSFSMSDPSLGNQAQKSLKPAELAFGLWIMIDTLSESVVQAQGQPQRAQGNFLESTSHSGIPNSMIKSSLSQSDTAFKADAGKKDTGLTQNQYFEQPTSMQHYEEQMAAFQQRTAIADAAIKKEMVQIQKLRIQIELFDKKIAQISNEMRDLQNK